MLRARIVCRSRTVTATGCAPRHSRVKDLGVGVWGFGSMSSFFAMARCFSLSAAPADDPRSSGQWLRHASGILGLR